MIFPRAVISAEDEVNKFEEQVRAAGGLTKITPGLAALHHGRECELLGRTDTYAAVRFSDTPEFGCVLFKPEHVVAL
jgi:hypothetical protein